MRKSRFTEAQRIAILKEAEGGAKVQELAREHGISTATIYSWRAKLGALEVNDAKRLKDLEAGGATQIHRSVQQYRSIAKPIVGLVERYRLYRNLGLAVRKTKEAQKESLAGTS